jgi:hypothetical protein
MVDRKTALGVHRFRDPARHSGQIYQPKGTGHPGADPDDLFLAHLWAGGRHHASAFVFGA